MSEIEELRSRIEALEARLEALSFGQVRAERLDIVDGDGTVRLAIANRERAGERMIEDEVQSPGRERTGLVLFNEDGHECGGLTWSAKRVGDHTEAYSVLSLDRYRGDQVVAVGYADTPDGYWAGMRVVDRKESGHAEAWRRYRELTAMAESPERDEALRELLADRPFGAMRMFVGRDMSGDATIRMYDGTGRPRLRFAVSEDGAALIEFLDERGEVVRRITQADD
ncbi:MAG TPA: hypothetical protein VNB24_09745 [Acidimicrobiales bacterium]|nr:hypothetical protein [Acidimicrobiales bacterium]